MINYLKGVIRRIHKEEARVVLDVKGVGYELLLPYFVMRSLEEEERGEGDEEEDDEEERTVGKEQTENVEP